MTNAQFAIELETLRNNCSNIDLLWEDVDDFIDALRAQPDPFLTIIHDLAVDARNGINTKGGTNNARHAIGRIIELTKGNK